MDALDESKLNGEEEESENALVEKYESTTRTRNLKGRGNNRYDPYKRLTLSSGTELWMDCGTMKYPSFVVLVLVYTTYPEDCEGELT